MKVLVACEESQEVCKAFRARGHEAYSCDIQECSGGHPEWHIKDDVLAVLYPDEWRGTNLHLQSGHICQIFKWDLIIAHPPCTYMSAAGACRMYPKAGHIDEERFAKAMDAKRFFMDIRNAPCQRICIENPRPLKCVELPKETQRIQPYEFGEPWSKLTYLWLKGLPPLVPTQIVSDYKPYVSCGTSRNKGNPENRHEQTRWGTESEKQNLPRRCPRYGFTMGGGETMSILIKGMEMPTRCGRCDMCITEVDGDIDSHKACCITGAIIENLGEKMEDCPLVPVPPHGRLIDADAVFKRLQKQAMSVWGNSNPRYQIILEVMDAIRFAPTIIEAEEGET